MHSETAHLEQADKAGPLIFRRLWMSGLLDSQDMLDLSRLPWTRRSLPADEKLDCGDDLCLLAGGLAFRQRWESAGDRQLLSVVVPGDICVYTCITGNRPMSTLTTATPSVTMSAPIRDVANLCEMRPNILAAILSNLSCDNAATEELLISVGRRSALKRVAHLFCELEFRLQRMGLARNAQYLLNLTQVEIGDHLALSAVHVNRTMQELRRRKLVRNRGPHLTLPDLAELQRLAGFTPDYLQHDPLSAAVAAE